jgi:hypothetical protein
MFSLRAWITNSVERLATGWIFGDRIPVGARFSTPFQIDPGALKTLYYSGYQVACQGIKCLGRGVNQSPLPGAEVKERVELYLSSSYAKMKGGVVTVLD